MSEKKDADGAPPFLRLPLTARFIQKFWAFLLGYDVFISHSHQDGRYALRLARLLSKNGYICYLDQLATKPSRELPDTIITAIGRSTVFVLVGTPNALGSTAVGLEVDLFLSKPHQAERPRNFIAIDVGGAVSENKDWCARIPGLRVEHEAATAVEKGKPSNDVIRRVFNSTKFNRRTLQLKWSLVFLAAGILLILCGAGAVFGYVIRGASVRAAAAVEARDRAEGERGNAIRLRDEAQEAARHAVTLREQAEHDAEMAQAGAEAARRAASEAYGARDRAQAAATAAQLQQAEAERKTALARRQQAEAERQKRSAVSEQIAAKSLTAFAESPPLGLRLSDAAFDVTREDGVTAFGAEEALRENLRKIGGDVIPGLTFKGAEGLRYSPDGHWLLVDNGRASAIAEADAADAKWIQLSPTPAASPQATPDFSSPQPSACENAAISPDSRWLVAECGATHNVWELRAGGAGPRLLDDSERRLLPKDTLKDGVARWLFERGVIDGPSPRGLRESADADASTEHPSAGGQPPKTPVEHEEVCDVHSSDWRWLVCHDDTTAEAFDWGSGQPKVPLKVIKVNLDPSVVESPIEITTDDRWLKVIKEDGRTELYSLADLRPDSVPVTIPSLGYDSEIKCASCELSPDGRWLVADGEDADKKDAFMLFDLRAPGAPKSYRLADNYSASSATPIFSRNSRWLILPIDNDLFYWDLQSPGGEPKRADLLGHSAFGKTAFSDDDKWLLWYDDDGAVQLRRLPDKGREAGPPNSALKRDLYNLRVEGGLSVKVRFSIGSRRLLGSAGSTVNVWDLSKVGESSFWWSPTLLRGHEGEILFITPSPDGRHFATLARDGIVRLWNSENLQESAQPRLFQAEKPFNGIQFSPNYRRLVTTANGQSSLLWDLKAIRPWESPVELPEAQLYNPYTSPRPDFFSSDGRWLIIPGRDGTARLWAVDNVRSGKPLLEFKVTAGAVAFSPNARYLVASGSDGITGVWDLPAATAAAPRLEFNNQTAPDVRFSFGNTSRWLIASSEQGVTRIYDLERGTAETLPGVDTKYSDFPKFSEGDRWLAFVSKDRITLRDLTGVAPRREIVLVDLNRIPNDNYLSRAHSFGFSAGGRWLYVVTSLETKLWDLKADGGPCDFKVSGHEDTARPRFSTDGLRFVLYGYNHNTRLCELGGTVPACEDLKGAAAAGLGLGDVYFSPDSRWLAIGPAGKRGTREEVTMIWDLRSRGDAPHELPTTIRDAGGFEGSPVFDPASRWLITFPTENHTNTRAVFWDLTLAEPFKEPAGGSESTTNFWSDSFSPDGRWLVGFDQSAHDLVLWDLSRKPMWTRPIVIGSDSYGHDFGFTPDGRVLFTIGDIVQRWDMDVEELRKQARRLAVRDLNKEERHRYLR